jgi:hypothetical protein
MQKVILHLEGGIQLNFIEVMRKEQRGGKEGEREKEREMERKRERGSTNPY